MKEETDNSWVADMAHLGLGYGLGPELLLELADIGAVYEDSDGTIRWSGGWNASNYMLKMEELKNQQEKNNIYFSGK